MAFIRRVLLLSLLLLAAGSAAPALAYQPPSPSPEQMGEFVPLKDLPAEEQLPAAPLVIGAYGFVWAAVLFYVVSIAKRLGSVQQDIARLETDLKQKR